MKKTNLTIMISFSQFKKIAFVGGGTGGHITPIIALINEHHNNTTEYIWIGGHDSLEESEAEKRGIHFFAIHTIKLSTTHSFKIFFYPFVILHGIFQARKVLLKEKPDRVFSKGGPGSVSVGIAAWLLGIPLWIHESDTIPGLSNRFLGYIAERIFLGFDSTRKYFQDIKCMVVGQIIDADILKPTKDYRYWKTTKKHIFVNCGSQGSKNIFKALSQYCYDIDAEWIVLLGRLNTDARVLFQNFTHITLYDWVDTHTLGSILSDTDITIARGGATSLAEIDLFKNKKIIIPLPWSASNHQYYNALWYQDNRGDIILEESDIKTIAEIITTTISQGLDNKTTDNKK